MPIPPSFIAGGFRPAAQARTRQRLRNGKLLKPLMIATEGESDTGKTEFALTAPSPGIGICLDRGIMAALDNPNPPETRGDLDSWAFKVIEVPMEGTRRQTDYVKYWEDFRDNYYKALENKDSITALLDGDSDSWELQRLAEFGKLTQIFPQTRYHAPYTSRRALINRAWDSGKIVIATNKVKDEYEDVVDAQGKPILDAQGEKTRQKTGNKEAQGFPDQDYLWQIRLRHLYKPAVYNPVSKKIQPAQWGIRILKCKHDKSHEGSELWGPECCFRSLVNLVYPEVPDEEWGLE